MTEAGNTKLKALTPNDRFLPFRRLGQSVGATVDLGTCDISADKGAAELATTWTDPDIKAEDAAFYYVRIVENPVCRYSQHDALALGVAHPDNVPQTIQERAWSSPIWYTPHQ